MFLCLAGVLPAQQQSVLLTEVFQFVATVHHSPRPVASRSQSNNNNIISMKKLKKIVLKVQLSI